MGHTNYVDRCCDRLIQLSQLASDRWLKRLVDFETLCRRVGGTFKYSDPDECKIRGENSICAIVAGFERELDNMKNAAAIDALGHGKQCLPPIVGNPPALHIWYSLLTKYRNNALS